MHVLHLSWEFPPHIVGGLGRHVAELAPAIAGFGDQLSVLVPLLRGGPSDEIIPPGVRVCRVPAPQMEAYDFPSFVAQTNLALERAAAGSLFAGGRPDLIHAHDWLAAQVAIALKHHWRIPLIATVHATERGRGRGYLNGRTGQLINDLEWRLTYEAWRVIVCSRFMAYQLHDFFSTPMDKIDLVPNGVSLSPDPFTSDAERAEFRRRFVADDEQLVFYVGRVVYEKGVHVLLDAWPQIAAQAPARLVVAGTGEYLDELKRRVAEGSLGGRTSFTGFISDEDRDRLYHVADVAVFPSLYEPFGIVALEACAALCPVVVAATGGLAEVITAGATGVVVPPGDAEALAAGVLECLHSPTLAHGRAVRALEIVRDKYTWARVAEETRFVYRRVYGEWLSGSWGKELATG